MAVTIQLRGDTSANWTLVNPILAEREIAIETDTLFYKIGDGITAWNSLSYNYLRSLDTGTVTVYENQVTLPTTPSAGYMKFFAKTLCGRMLPRILGPSGIATPLQPSFFQNNISIINTGVTTALTTIGTAVTSVGTISHPVVTELYGYMANIASAATANITCGTGDNLVKWIIGSLAGGSSGFFFSARIAYPDSNYNETGASTGTRMFVGLTDQTLAVTVGSDSPAGNRIGFSRLHVNGATQDTTWVITTKNGVSETRTNTGMTFNPQVIYDFYLFCRPLGTEVYWRIDDLINETSYEGIVVDTLPLNTVFMRSGAQLQTVNAVSRNIRIQRIYCESDR
jgi:hypothetical protein